MGIEESYAGSVRAAMTRFYDDLGRIVQKYDGKPVEGSQAMKEFEASPRRESITTAWWLGLLLFESGSEHVIGFVQAITEPTLPLFVWTSVRSMLESCALAGWFLDPAIDGMGRISRTFAHRYEGIQQEMKLCRSLKRPDDEIKVSLDRIDAIENDAVAIGLDAVRGGGKRVSIGERVLGATEMISLMLDDEVAYRLLSGVEHGHGYALKSVGLAREDSGDTMIGDIKALAFRKELTDGKIAYLAARVIKAMAVPAWNMCRYFGWNRNEMEEVLEDVADGVKWKEEQRFWRERPAGQDKGDAGQDKGDATRI